MITLITGYPGSGKSHYMVESCILPAVAKGKTVITNVKGLQIDGADIHVFDTKTDYGKRNLYGLAYAVTGEKADKDLAKNDLKYSDWNKSSGAVTFKVDSDTLMVNYQNVPITNAILVLDEAQNIFAQTVRESACFYNAVWRKFYTEHRHAGFDVYMVTQNVGQINREAYKLCEYRVHLVNLGSLGLAKWYLYYKTRNNTKYAVWMGRYKKKVLDVYKSTQDDVDGSSHGKRGLAGAWVWILILLGAFVSWYLFKKLTNADSFKKPSAQTIEKKGLWFYRPSGVFSGIWRQGCIFAF